jgi:anthranilate phosphoribosyltransferase
VLSKAGVKIDMGSDTARLCLDEVGVTFLYAPKYHPGMRHAAPVRKALGVRTVFNILGPLLNPSRPKVQLTGVYSEDLVKPYALTLQKLGLKRGLVVHGSGLDEIALHGPTKACLIQENELEDMVITPEEAGLRRHDLDRILGSDPDYNYAALMDLLSGKGSEAYSDVVALNAGALYWCAGRSQTLQEATGLALQAIASGKCLHRLRHFVEMSHHAG